MVKAKKGTSIVMITLLRILLSVYDHPENRTKAQAVTALITGLEPICGVMNACLPCTPLVFQRLTSTKVFQRVSTSLRSFMEASSRTKNSTQRNDVHLQNGRSGHYRGLPSIEMHPIPNSRTVNSVVTSGRNEGQRRLEDDDEYNGHIFMHRDYSIQSEPQRSDVSV